MNNLLPFLITALCVICQWLSLLLAGQNKDKVWKVGIHFGMGGSGWAAAGFASYERLNPYPWHTFGVATLFMLSCVVLAYYQSSEPGPDATPQQIQENDLRQHRALLRAGVGLIAVLCIAVIVAFMDGKKEGEKLQAVSVEVLSDVVIVLKQLQRTAQSNVRRLDERDRADFVADSTFRAQSLKNQRTGLRNQADILREQVAVKRNLRLSNKAQNRPAPLYILPPTPKTVPAGQFPLSPAKVQPVPTAPTYRKNRRTGWQRIDYDEWGDSSRYARRWE